MNVQSEEAEQTVDSAPSLGDQLQEMEETLHLFQRRIEVQDRNIHDFRAQATRISESLAEVQARTDEVKAKLLRTPRKKIQVQAAAPKPVEPAAPVRQAPLPPARRPVSYAAFAVLALTAMLLDFHGAPARETPPPAPIAPIAAVPRKLPPPLIERDDDSDAALKLVYLFKLPGRKETILDVLGYKDDDMLNNSPWQVERLDRDTYLVTYKAPGEEASYHFEVDVGAKSVYVQPDTKRQLLAAAD